MTNKIFMKQNATFAEVDNLIKSIKLYSSSSELLLVTTMGDGTFEVCYKATSELLENSQEVFAHVDS